MEELKLLKQEINELKDRLSALENRKTSGKKNVSSIENYNSIKTFIEANYAVSEPYILSFSSNEDISQEISSALNIPDNRKTKYCIGLILGKLGAEKTNSKVGGVARRGYFLARKI